MNPLLKHFLLGNFFLYQLTYSSCCNCKSTAFQEASFKYPFFFNKASALPFCSDLQRGKEGSNVWAIVLCEQYHRNSVYSWTKGVAAWLEEVFPSRCFSELFWNLLNIHNILFSVLRKLIAYKQLLLHIWRNFSVPRPDLLDCRDFPELSSMSLLLSLVKSKGFKKCYSSKKCYSLWMEVIFIFSAVVFQVLGTSIFAKWSQLFQPCSPARENLSLFTHVFGKPFDAIHSLPC